jgi:hypothetical protein
VARSAATPAYGGGAAGPPVATPGGRRDPEGALPRGTAEGNAAIRKRVESRMSGLENNRYSWWQHWRLLATYTLPRRYKWLVTPNEQARGSPINSAIIDSTSMLAARTLTSGLLSGLTNPATPWFKFEIDGFSDPGSDVVLWLAECQRRMSTVFQESNFYNSMAVMYFDLVVFGTAAVLIYDDFDDVIRCFNPCLGEYFIDVDNKHRVVVFYRKFVMTTAQIVTEFGEENCSDSIQRLYKEGGTSLTLEHVVAHAIEPNDDELYGVPKRFKFRECYWQWGSSQELLLRKKGFREFPGFVPRWDVVGNDPYGRSPGMDAYGDDRQLQQETKRKGQAIDKMVNPPLKADVQLKNQPASMLPGGITYVNGMGRDRPGLEPIFTIMPPIAEMKQDIAEIQDRIRRTYFNNLFTDISNLDTVRTASEIRARVEEKLVMLPVIKRLDNEALAPAIERTWAIMQRAGLLPPPPQGAPINGFVAIRYISPFAMAMRAAETTAIERSMAFGGNLVAVDHTVLDNYDLDATVHLYTAALGADMRMLRTDEDRDGIRQQRGQQAQQQQAMQQAQQMAQVGGAAVSGAKVLSETDVGGGQNALQAMLGGGAVGPGGGMAPAGGGMPA